MFLWMSSFSLACEHFSELVREDAADLMEEIASLEPGQRLLDAGRHHTATGHAASAETTGRRGAPPQVRHYTTLPN
jgi:hypothetical protein